METLNYLERAVLDKLLAGDHPALPSLRAQLAACLVEKRTLSGKGFFTEFRLPDDSPRAELHKDRVRFGDVIADLEGVPHGAGFVLFIDDGRLTMLEGYTFEGPWPEHPRILRLSFIAEPRDFSELT